MDMDKAPLNKAHQLERKAEAFIRQKKLDECLQCHSEAVEMYNKCLELGENKVGLESIQLQKEWNERQIRMLQFKKSYLERTERERKVKGITSTKHSQKEAVEHLEEKIFRSFEIHDSLICYLAQRGIINPQDKNYHSTIEESEERDDPPAIIGNKHPKGDDIVIEELKELSGQLRESVQGLLIRLDVRKSQNDQLREHIKSIELETSYKEGLLIQLDDRNKEIEQLKAYINDLKLEKPMEGDSQINNKSTAESSDGTSPPNASSTTDLYPDFPDLKSFPNLESINLPEVDLSAFKQFRMPEVSCKLLRKDE